MCKHNAARNLVASFANKGGLHPALERPGLLQPSPEQPDAQRRRPADVFLPSWEGGRPAALDLAITCPQRQDLRALAAQRSGAAAKAYEQTKREYLGTAAQCEAQGFSFVPFVGETSGGWGPSAICTLKAFARASAVRTGVESGVIKTQQLQALGSAVRRSHARAVLRRDTGSDAPADTLVSAAAVLAETAPTSG